MLLIYMATALARALAAQAAAVVQTTAFRRRALQVAVQSAAKRFRRGFIPRQLNLPALAGKSLSFKDVKICLSALNLGAPGGEISSN
ncbi:MAG: hypothetical protein F9K25_15730 [Candidatus Contendobacter sp.]|nr:MAG: hypothetical protein F9K25_15730 [Candidatus Contendobacter sp.]